MPTNYSKYQGDEVILDVAFKDKKGKFINAMDYTVTFNLRKAKADTSAVLSKTFEVKQGQAQVCLTVEETKALNGDYYYEIAYITDYSTFEVIDSGTFSFK
jgi:hypothetical protein